MTLKKHARSALALLLAVVLCIGMVPTAFAAQETATTTPQTTGRRPITAPMSWMSMRL